MYSDKGFVKAAVGGLAIGVVTGLVIGPTITGYAISMVGGAAWGAYCAWEELDPTTKAFVKYQAKKQVFKLKTKLPFQNQPAFH